MRAKREGIITIAVLGTVAIIVCVAMLLAPPAQASTVRTDVPIYNVVKFDLHSDVLVQYLDGSEVRTLRFGTLDDRIHFVENSTELRLVKNETLGPRSPWLLDFYPDMKVVSVEWELYIGQYCPLLVVIEE